MTIQGLNYPDTKPSRTFDFANSRRLDPAVLFSRQSAAFDTDPVDGLKSAPAGVARFVGDAETGETLGLLLEESRTNVVRNSARFTDGNYWGYSQGVRVLPNQAMAPDGTFNGTLIQQDSSDSFHVLAKGGLNNSVASSSAPYTLSICVKKYNSNRITLQEAYHYNPNGYTKAGIVWDFAAEAFVKTIQWNNSVGSRIFGWSSEKYPDGWYRLTLTVMPGSDTNNRRVYPSIAPHDATIGLSGSGVPSGAIGIPGANYYSGNRPSFNGDNVSGVYIWNFQVELGGYPTSHIPTPATFTSRSTAARYYDAAGVIQTAAVNVARDNAFFPDQNGIMRPAGLLVEPGAVNLAEQSQTFSTWDLTGCTLASDAVTAPDGTATAIKLSETTALDFHRVSLPVTLTGIHTLSVFARADERTILTLAPASTGGGDTPVYFDLTTGVVLGSVPSGLSVTVRRFPSGWVRCSVTGEMSNFGYPFIGTAAIPGVQSYGGSSGFGILIWGAQLEAGSRPSSYIPTTSNSASRSGDVISTPTVLRPADEAIVDGLDLSGWYNQTEGTMLAVYRSLGGGEFFRAWYTGASETGMLNPNGEDGRVTPVIAGQAVAGGITEPNGKADFDRSALALQSNNFAWTVNGATPQADTTAILPTGQTSLRMASTNAADATQQGSLILQRLNYWPTRLSEAALQAITR